MCKGEQAWEGKRAKAGGQAGGRGTGTGTGSEDKGGVSVGTKDKGRQIGNAEAGEMTDFWYMHLQDGRCSKAFRTVW